MIVEFVGSTGAGKSTLIRAVRQRLQETAVVTTPYELLASPIGLSHVQHTTARNLIQEILGLPFFLAGTIRHYAFVAVALRLLARQASFSVYSLNNLRSLVRKVSAHDLAHRQNPNRVILVDEGTILFAHNVFVYSDTSYQHRDIEALARWLPLPNLVIHVRAPIDSLIARSVQRLDPPREMRGKNTVQIEQYVASAAALFDKLTALPRLRDRVLRVDNLDTAAGVNPDAVNTIARFILAQPATGHVANRTV